MINTELDLDEILLSEETQIREEINLSVVKEYAELMADGVEFPPVEVVYDGENYILVDGFHRVQAVKIRKEEKITANIFEGTKRDAVLYAVKSNVKHGLKRLNIDKRKAVVKLLQDEEWGKWTNARIAEYCGVSSSFVDNIRNSLSSNYGMIDNETRMAKRGGKEYEIKIPKRDKSPQAKSKDQEKRIAEEVDGRTTIASGALPFQKGDVEISDISDFDMLIEAKRTDGQEIKVKKDWFKKLKKQAGIRRPVIAIEIQDEQWYIIRPEDFQEYLFFLREK